ncbi:MAG: DUF998 domain-containing protein [Arenibacter latericius]|nr:DUF998 domain-containing protein [Arenibacter latericius]
MANQPNKTRIRIFWFGLSGVLLFVLATIMGGIFMEDYSHTRQLISESYAHGTTYGPLLRWAGFIPSGISIAIFSFLAPLVLPKSKLVSLGFWVVGVFYGIGTIIVSLFPCDIGCNPQFIDPSASQIIHTIVGAFTYIVVPSGLILIGFGSKSTMRIVSLVCGILAYGFVGLLINDATGPYIGLFQRVVEACTLGWLIYMSYYIKRNAALS